MLLFAVAAMVMAACGGNQAQGGEAEVLSAPVDSLVKTAEATKTEVKAKRKTPNLWTANAVEVRIRGCFAEVNRMAAGDGIDVGLLDNKYCSKDFLELKRNLATTAHSLQADIPAMLTTASLWSFATR